MFNELNQQIKENSKEIAAVAHDVSDIKLTLENTTNKNIQLLAEGFDSMCQKTVLLDAVPEQLTKIRSDVEMIKDVVTDHSVEINRMVRVK